MGWVKMAAAQCLFDNRFMHVENDCFRPSTPSAPLAVQAQSLEMAEVRKMVQARTNGGTSAA